MTRLLPALAALALIPLAATAGPADDTRAEIDKTLGFTPDFVKSLPDSALPGLWAETRDLEFSEGTALDPKTKALISLAVAAQIPCSYCIAMDTATARSNGATDAEIGEAVAIAGMTRNWSTIFNGLQVDLETFKKQFGGM